jgi:hypothetical protein
MAFNPTAKEIKQEETLPGKIKAWSILALAVSCLLVFIYILGPMGLDLSFIKPMASFIAENNINANAYYYTEVPEFRKAELYMRGSLKYAPNDGTANGDL